MPTNTLSITAVLVSTEDYTPPRPRALKHVVGRAHTHTTHTH